MGGGGRRQTMEGSRKTWGNIFSLPCLADWHPVSFLNIQRKGVTVPRKGGYGFPYIYPFSHTTTNQLKSQLRTTPMADKTTAGDVLVYIPNLIGYLRVALTLTSIVLMICYPGYWVIAIAFYMASFVGDLFDGMAARKFDQCSSFGGLIDMVTDRCSTAGLLCVLSREYSNVPTLVLVRRCCMHYCVRACLK